MKSEVIKRDVKCNKCGGTGSYSGWDGHKFSPTSCKECSSSGVVKIGCEKQLFKASGEISSRCGQQYNCKRRFCARCKRLDKKYKDLDLINAKDGMEKKQ